MPLASPAYPAPPPRPAGFARPRRFIIPQQTSPGFFLFLILNATLFIRPSEIVPALLGWHIYLVLILVCAGLALPAILDQLSHRCLSRRPITVCVLGLLPAVLLSHLAHFDTEKAALSGFAFAKVVIYYLLLVAMVTTNGRLRGFLFSFALFSAVATALALLQYHGVINIANLAVLTDTQFDPLTGRNTPVMRLRGTGIFHDPNDLCLLLVVGAVLSVYWLADRRLGTARFAWALALVLFLYALYLTKSRGGFLGFLTAVLVFLTARFGWKRSLGLAALVLPALFVVFAGRQADLSMASNTGQTRLQLWQDGLMLFRGSPLFGIGMDEYANEAGQVAHNSFLHCFAELGLGGGMLFLGAFFAAFMALSRLGLRRRQVMDPELRRLRPYLLAVVAAYSVGMLTLSVPYIVPTYTILGLATAYLSMEKVAVAWADSSFRQTGFYRRPSPSAPWSLLVGQVVLVSILFLAAVYVLVRLFVRW